MSTPIEIVRAQSNWWKRDESSYPPHTQDELYTALASVLCDAERYKALEDAAYIEVRKAVGDGDYRARPKNGRTHICGTTLAELADRLREETK